MVALSLADFAKASKMDDVLFKAIMEELGGDQDTDAEIVANIPQDTITELLPKIKVGTGDEQRALRPLEQGKVVTFFKKVQAAFASCPAPPRKAQSLCPKSWGQEVARPVPKGRRRRCWTSWTIRPSTP